MPQQRIIQTNFTAGEFSPRLFGRPDLQRYANGAAELFNAVVLPQGGMVRRTGSYYLGTVKDQSTRVRLISFVVSDIASYVIELGNLYARFWRNRALVASAGVPIEVVTPYTTAELRSIRYAQSADVMYLCHPAHPPQKLSRVAADQFSIAPVNFLDGPYQTENTGDVGPSGGSGSTSLPGDGGPVVDPNAGAGQ